ncbi:MAG: hypothetical protein Q8L64_02345 [bacterium]|nr:hypothetical protein [bacterium]MDP2777225.1 hypothetical protein [Anaerolineales bacterium]
MTTELMTEAGVEQTILDEPAMKEYSVVMDGVIEIVKGLDEKSFFDGLLDTMIEYIEKHGAFAGLSMSHREYVDDDTEGTDGKEAT